DPATDLDAAGVNPGDQFRLVFVTTDSFESIFPSVNTYNAIAEQSADDFNAEMNSLLGSVIQDDFSGNAASITYNAIGSTSSIDARDNTNTNPFSDGEGEPILLVDGAIVANDYNDLWDGDINSPINVNSDGGPTDGLIWTGTSISGELTPNLGLTNSFVTIGSNRLDNGWINHSNAQANNFQFNLYGMSEPLTRANNQPTAVPFHTDTLPGLIAMGGLIFWRYRRQKRKAD
ncbi:UNVERIFIED_CONTAM: hypothetical protein BEN50_07560, partial [Euhalothece sp. KZN 001]